MVKCQRRLIAAIIILVAVSLCGAGVTLLIQVRQPVFFFTYSSYQLKTNVKDSQDYLQFTLKYIANIDDTETVSLIEFPEAAESNFIFLTSELKSEPQSDDTIKLLYEEPETSNILKVGRYAVHTVTVTVLPKDAADISEKTVLHEAKITYSNKKTQMVSIGCIELYRSKSEDKTFSWTSSTGYRNGLSDSTLNVNENITVLSLVPQCMPELSDSIKYNVNGIDYKEAAGMKCPKGSSLNLHSEIQLSKDMVIRQNEYNIRMIMHYLDDEGQEHESVIDFISHSPTHDNFWELERYLKARKAI